MNNSLLNTFYKNKWVVGPIVAFLGIITGFIYAGSPIFGHFGVAGCVIASFIIAFIAYSMPKKDILSLLTPLYAIIIFNPWSEFSSGLIMQVLYALTLLIIAFRLEKRFNIQ